PRRIFEMRRRSADVSVTLGTRPKAFSRCALAAWMSFGFVTMLVFLFDMAESSFPRAGQGGSARRTLARAPLPRHRGHDDRCPSSPDAQQKAPRRKNRPAPSHFFVEHA